jgi:FixJ family two-component response regulator
MIDSQGIVIVVDDDVSVRESLEPLLAHAGWRPHTFGCAQEFLAYPRPTVPNCLVLDVSLPGPQRPRAADAARRPTTAVTGGIS